MLAIKENERDENLSARFKQIPYLNSSLFTKAPCEQNREISLLESKPLKLYPSSILKKDAQKDELPLLEYFFCFLAAYDFTTTPKDIQNHAKTNHDKLINSSVLGLVFEKLNGYKEGSFYTPSFITNYMCEQSITKIVLDKFNAELNINAKNLTELENKISDEKSALEILHSVKICDPSVGSAHFLVSALNHMILIQFKLKLLLDEQGSRLKDINLKLENDEIIITDSESNIHQYQLPAHENIEAHRIQKTIFQAKKQIIESCLFGVDINPNSCEIAKLRLWIELLKYSFYTDLKERYLETLPNIDINIKCGNSLINHIRLSSTIDNFLENTKKQESKSQDLFEKKELDSFIKDTKRKFENELKKSKESVSSYINAKGNQATIYKNQYENSKQYLINLFYRDCDWYINFYFELKDFFCQYGYINLRDLDSETRFSIESYVSEFDFQKFVDFNRKINPIDKKRLSKLLTLMNAYENALKQNAFEWRFEFPEVLDSNGNFLGFDLIIGNPPYIRQEEIKDQKAALSKLYTIYNSTSDIYTYFYELALNVLRENAIFCLITSNKYARAGYGANLREFLLKNTALLSYTELNGIKVFDAASVDTSILSAQKIKLDSKTHHFDYFTPEQKQKDPSTIKLDANKAQMSQACLSKDAFLFLSASQSALKAKIERIGVPLKEWDINIYRGILTGLNEAFVIDFKTRAEILQSCQNDDERTRTEKLMRPMLRGRDIKRYCYKWAELYLINTHNGYTDANGDKIPPIDIEQYPALKAHLDKCKAKLQKREDKGTTPYNLRNCAYLPEFEKPKIVWAEMTNEPCFILDESGTITNQTCYFIPCSDKYLLGVLNSKLIHYYMSQMASGLGEGALRWIRQFVEKLPIPKITESNKHLADEIIKIVEQILKIKSQDNPPPTTELESKIDELVYQLYNLSDDEIKIIQQ